MDEGVAAERLRSLESLAADRTNQVRFRLKAKKGRPFFNPGLHLLNFGDTRRSPARLWQIIFLLLSHQDRHGKELSSLKCCHNEGFSSAKNKIPGCFERGSSELREAVQQFSICSAINNAIWRDVELLGEVPSKFVRPHIFIFVRVKSKFKWYRSNPAEKRRQCIFDTSTRLSISCFIHYQRYSTGGHFKTNLLWSERFTRILALTTGENFRWP